MNLSAAHQIQALAEMVHEVNRAYCKAIGDNSQLPWAAAEKWQKDSAIQGVETLLADPGMGPEALHENWCEVKRADGWVYGPVKDPAKKEHPCMVSYDQLPLEQRVKDHLFRAVVFAAIKHVR